MRPGGMGGAWLRWIGVLGMTLGSLGPSLHAQGLPSASPPPSALPAPAPAAVTERPDPTSVEEFVEYLRAMEAQNRILTERLERIDSTHDAEMRVLLEKVEELSRKLDAGVSAGTGGPAGANLIAPSGSAEDMGTETSVPPAAFDNQPDDPGSPVPDYRDGAATPDFPLPPDRPPNLIESTRIPLLGTFGPGFQFLTPDEEFLLQVEYESQVEGRIWSPNEDLVANSGVYLPRQRFFFRGRITKPVEYELSINRGLNNINLLNAYINLHFDDRIEFRFGRFFTPLAYEQYAISNYWLLTPERSPFTTNVGLNRQIGAMAWGYLFDKRLDYAAGVFNGSRNSFENLNDGVDFVSFLNARPFQKSELLQALRFLNLGASVGAGTQDQPPVPGAFRIGAGSPDANIPGIATVPFLIFNPDVIERGDRLIGSTHAAYFYEGLSVIGEWQFGYNSYASPSSPSPRRVPLSGFYAAAGYFLTGEKAERRTRIRPLRPFVPMGRGDRRGPGAWELTGRVSRFNVGREVFDHGFADRRLWSDTALTTEVGLNWYWNDYIKIYMFWLRGQFGDPVATGPGSFRESVDMFWLRFQLYY